MFRALETNDIRRKYSSPICARVRTRESVRLPLGRPRTSSSENRRCRAIEEKSPRSAAGKSDADSTERVFYRLLAVERSMIHLVSRLFEPAGKLFIEIIRTGTLVCPSSHLCISPWPSAKPKPQAPL